MYDKISSERLRQIRSKMNRQYKKIVELQEENTKLKDELSFKEDSFPIKDEEQEEYKEQQTLAIIKPNAVMDRNIGKIIDWIEMDCFDIVSIKLVSMDEDMAEKFYAEHKGKHFFDRLVNFMASGDSIVLILQGINAIGSWRETMKHVREIYSGNETYENAVHGSDSIESAKREIKFFFGENNDESIC